MPAAARAAACPYCREVVTDAEPAGWRIRLLCKEHSSDVVCHWDRHSPRPRPQEQLSAGLPDDSGEREAAEEWARRGLVMGVTPEEFERLQLLLRKVYDAVGRTGWRRAFLPAAPERALFTQSLPDLAVWTPPTAQSRTGPRSPGPEPELEPEPEPRLETAPHALPFGSFARLVRGKLGASAVPDEQIVRLWLLLDAVPPRGQLTWAELSHAVRHCPLYSTKRLAHPRIPHPDAAGMPPWADGQRVFVLGCGMGTVVDLNRMGGDVRVAVDDRGRMGGAAVWRRREDLVRVATHPCTVQSIASDGAAGLRLMLQQALRESPGTPARRRRSPPRQGGGLWATSPIRLRQSTPSSPDPRHKKARRRERTKKKGADRQRREERARMAAEAEREAAAAQKIYRASRLYGILGELDPDDDTSPRTWWRNERERKARIAEARAAAKAAPATPAEAVLPVALQASPYAGNSTRLQRASPRGPVQRPPARGGAPVAPRFTHLIPQGPLVWDPIKGFEEPPLSYPSPRPAASPAQAPRAD